MKIIINWSPKWSLSFLRNHWKLLIKYFLKGHCKLISALESSALTKPNGPKNLAKKKEGNLAPYSLPSSAIIMRFQQNHDQQKTTVCAFCPLYYMKQTLQRHNYTFPFVLQALGCSGYHTLEALKWAQSIWTVCGLIVVVLANLLYTPSAARLSRLRGRITINSIIVHLHHYLTKLTQYARSGTGDKLSHLCLCGSLANQMLPLHVIALFPVQEAEKREVDGKKEQIESNMKGMQTQTER